MQREPRPFALVVSRPSFPACRTFLSSFLAASSVLLVVVLIAGCGVLGGEPEATPTTQATPLPVPTTVPTPTPEPLRGNLTIRLAEDVPVLRPWRPESRGAEQIIGMLYSGLIRLDNQLRPQPDLATEWETTPDGRVLTFTLRDDVTWHDGQPFDAEDVRFTLDRMRRLPFTTTALLADLRYVTAVSVPSSYTIVLSLTERYAPLLAELAMPILPSHLLEADDLYTTNFWDLPVGTGPFMLDSRVPGQSVVLSRNLDFYRGAPLLERVAFVGAADASIALNALQEETLLMAELPWDAMPKLADTVPHVRVDSYAENGFYFLGFNLREGRPFADVRVRRALKLALDLGRLVEAATSGQGIPIGSSAAPGSWADLTPPDLSPPDLETARALMQEAGWVLAPGSTIRQRNGENFVATLFVRGDDPRRLVAAQRIAQTAASLGMQITVEPADFETVILSKYVPPYDFDLLLGSWLNGAGDPDFGDYRYYDPDDFALFHSSQIVEGELDTRITRNIVAFNDSAYDNQAQAARQIYSLNDRISAYQQTQERIAAQLPYIYLWADRIPVALNVRVRAEQGDIDMASPRVLWNIEQWYVEQP